MPIVAADGTTWLNNVLGAEYNNVHSANFNPTQQAQNLDDYLAYGSLFQWGRPADGHELRTCTSGTACTAKYSDTSTQNSNLTPANNLFITGSSDWSTTDSDGSQRTAFLSKTDGTGICPAGFRLPTETELEATRVAENITNEASYLSSTLQGALGGFRLDSNAVDVGAGENERIWVATYNTHIVITNTSTTQGGATSSYGFAARCRQDL